MKNENHDLGYITYLCFVNSSECKYIYVAFRISDSCGKLPLIAGDINQQLLDLVPLSPF